MADSRHITRRAAIVGLAASASVLPVIACEASADPIVGAIRDFRAGLAAFNALPNEVTDKNEDQAINATYGPPQQILMDWEAPAKSHEGAVEALRLARDEAAEFAYSAISDNMVIAALAYLEGRAIQ